jgi:hypothetical protein
MAARADGFASRSTTTRRYDDTTFTSRWSIQAILETETTSWRRGVVPAKRDAVGA